MNTITKNIILAPFNLLYKINPAFELKLMFRLKQGYGLDLKNPKTYNEKLQWIKLYDKNEWMPKCCDKYAVREYVEKMGCADILNTLYWHGTNPDDIPYDELPDKFVIKVTHGSTFNIIVTDKSKLDKEATRKKLIKWLNEKFIPCYGEWFYGKVPPQIIVEKFIESSDDKQLRDYKVFCFGGIPRIVRVDTDRFTNHKMDFFTPDWERINEAGMGYPISGRDFEKPTCLEQLLAYARKLSSPFLHARVDFYIVGNKPIFGEITFTNGAGFDKFSSYEFDLKMGSFISLPISKTTR